MSGRDAWQRVSSPPRRLSGTAAVSGARGRPLLPPPCGIPPRLLCLPEVSPQGASRPPTRRGASYHPPTPAALPRGISSRRLATHGSADRSSSAQARRSGPVAGAGPARAAPTPGPTGGAGGGPGRALALALAPLSESCTNLAGEEPPLGSSD